MMTGKLITIARPYAMAAFEYAVTKQEVPAWENMLAAAALVTQDTRVQQLLASPAISEAERVNFYSAVLAQVLNPEQTNFLHLLGEYNRLLALPDIAELFKFYRALQEKKLTVRVTSATALDETYQRRLVEALTKRLARHVSLECVIDENLLGGAIISAGDMVIDGSIRSKLNRMIEFISGTSLR